MYVGRRSRNKSTRREVLQKAGLSLAATVPTLGAISGTATADFPYDTIEGDYGRRSIRHTQNSLWDNYIKISLASTVDYLGSHQFDDDRWSHKFSINTQALSYHTNWNQLRDAIGNHSAKIKSRSPDSSLALHTPDQLSESVGAKPTTDNNADVIEEFLEPAINTTASLLSDKYAVASAGSSIINSLYDAVNHSSNNNPDEENYEWYYYSDEKEVAHQARFHATTAPGEHVGLEVITQADSETAISFYITVGEDSGYVSPYQPPDNASFIGSSNSTSKGQSNRRGRKPDYLPRDALRNSRRNRQHRGKGIPPARDMDEEQKKEYGVSRLATPQRIETDEGMKKVTHIADNLPINAFALEPPERFQRD